MQYASIQMCFNKSKYCDSQHSRYSVLHAYTLKTVSNSFISLHMRARYPTKCVRRYGYVNIVHFKRAQKSQQYLMIIIWTWIDYHHVCSLGVPSSLLSNGRYIYRYIYIEYIYACVCICVIYSGLHIDERPRPNCLIHANRRRRIRKCFSSHRSLRLTWVHTDFYIDILNTRISWWD